MSERLSYDRAVELLHQVIDEFGAGYVYATDDGGHCFYVTAGKPACLVAQVLARGGVPLEGLADLDAQSCSDVSSQAVRFEAWAEPDAVVLLANAQDQQDGGATWGNALEFALNQQIGERE